MSEKHISSTESSCPDGRAQASPPKAEKVNPAGSSAEKYSGRTAEKKSTYELKDGEFLHDREGSTQSKASLNTHINLMAASNVFNMLFSHTQLSQKDRHRSNVSFYRNPRLNRYADIPCIENTRVVLANTTDRNDYIHANYCDGYREAKKFIITQVPFPHTLPHYWHMIWQEKAVMIVSLIQLYESQTENSARFIPTGSGQSLAFGSFTVTHCGTRHLQCAFDATVLKVVCKEEERRILCLIYHGWQEKGTPRRPSELLNFISEMNFNRQLLIQQGKKDGWLTGDMSAPIVLNCLAGVGRSCALAAIDICCRKMDDTKDRDGGPLLDVDDTVARLRSQRAVAVQKGEQLLLIYFCVLEYATRMKYIPDRLWDEINLDGFKYKARHDNATKADVKNPSFERGQK